MHKKLTEVSDSLDIQGGQHSQEVQWAFMGDVLHSGHDLGGGQYNST